MKLCLRPALAWVFAVIVHQGVFAAEPMGAQSFESCSLITSEYVTVLQLMHRGFDLEALQATLPGLSEAAGIRIQTLYHNAQNDGLPETFSAVNSEYARCAKTVYDSSGTPSRASREGHFYFCAGENKVRYEILMAATIGARPGEVSPQLAVQHQPTAQALFSLYRNQGALTVFDILADELKFCINNDL